MTRLLKALGPMRVSEHERTVSFLARDDWKGVALDFEAKYKRAVTDLAAQADRIKKLESDILGFVGREEWDRVIADELREEVIALRPDAEAMRAKRKRDRDMKAAKRGAS